MLKYLVFLNNIIILRSVNGLRALINKAEKRMNEIELVFNFKDSMYYPREYFSNIGQGFCTQVSHLKISCYVTNP